jgi:hypothetical protein
MRQLDGARTKGFKVHLEHQSLEVDECAKELRQNLFLMTRA